MKAAKLQRGFTEKNVLLPEWTKACILSIPSSSPSPVMLTARRGSKIDNHRLQDWKRQKIPAGKCLEKFYFEHLTQETGKKKKKTHLWSKNISPYSWDIKYKYTAKRNSAHLAGFLRSPRAEALFQQAQQPVRRSALLPGQDRSFPKFAWSWVTETSLQEGASGGPWGAREAPSCPARLARGAGSASRANRSPRTPTWLVSSPCSKCTMPWLLHSVSLSTSSSESSRRDEEPVEETEELDSLRDCRCSELPVLSPPPSGRGDRAWGLPCASSLSSAVTVSRGMTGGRTPFGGRQPLLGRSGSWRAAAAATAAQRASKREQSSPTVSRLARLSSGLLCSPARGSMARSVPGACRAALQDRRPEACMGERRAAAGETSLWLSQSPTAARSPAERRISSPPCPGSSESPAETAGGCYPGRWPGARAMGARWARPIARPPPPPRSASALRGGANRVASSRVEPRRGSPFPPPPPQRRFGFAFPAAAPGERPGGVPVPVRMLHPAPALPPRRRSRSPPLAGPRLPGHGGCAAPATRGPEGRCGPTAHPRLGTRGRWPLTLPGGSDPLRAACGGLGSVCDRALGARWHRGAPPGHRGCRGGTAASWRGSAGAGVWPGCHQPAGTGWRSASGRAVPAAEGSPPAALRVPAPRCSTPGGLRAAWDGGWGQRRPPGTRTVCQSARYLLSRARSGCLKPPVAAIPQPPLRMNFRFWHPLPWYFSPAELPLFT